MTLRKRDFQLFMKRLRKEVAKDDKDIRVKYYAVGEYGEKNSRPHYHAILFNVPTIVSFSRAWTLQGSQLGTIDVGQVSGDSIAYVCKYMDKRKTIPAHNRDDRETEFSLMSRHLGDNYMTCRTIQYHKENLDKFYLTSSGGHKIAMPRYYRDKIFSEEEKIRQLDIIDRVLTHKEAYERFHAERKGKDYDKKKDDARIARARKFQKKNSKNRKL
jgi:hypothetical protein